MKPLPKRFFGPGTGTIRIKFNDGERVTDGYIVKQTASRRFIVAAQDNLSEVKIVGTTDGLTDLTYLASFDDAPTAGDTISLNGTTFTFLEAPTPAFVTTDNPYIPPESPVELRFGVNVGAQGPFIHSITIDPEDSGNEVRGNFNQVMNSLGLESVLLFNGSNFFFNSPFIIAFDPTSEDALTAMGFNEVPFILPEGPIYDPTDITQIYLPRANVGEMIAALSSVNGVDVYLDVNGRVTIYSRSNVALSGSALASFGLPSGSAEIPEIVYHMVSLVDTTEEAENLLPGEATLLVSPLDAEAIRYARKLQSRVALTTDGDRLSWRVATSGDTTQASVDTIVREGTIYRDQTVAFKVRFPEPVVVTGFPDINFSVGGRILLPARFSGSRFYYIGDTMGELGLNEFSQGTIRIGYPDEYINWTYNFTESDMTELTVGGLIEIINSAGIPVTASHVGQSNSERGGCLVFTMRDGDNRAMTVESAFHILVSNSANPGSGEITEASYVPRTVRQANYTSGSGTDVLTFTFTNTRSTTGAFPRIYPDNGFLNVSDPAFDLDGGSITYVSTEDDADFPGNVQMPFDRTFITNDYAPDYVVQYFTKTGVWFPIEIEGFNIGLVGRYGFTAGSRFKVVIGSDEYLYDDDITSEMTFPDVVEILNSKQEVADLGVVFSIVELSQPDAPFGYGFRAYSPGYPVEIVDSMQTVPGNFPFFGIIYKIEENQTFYREGTAVFSNGSASLLNSSFAAPSDLDGYTIVVKTVDDEVIPVVALNDSMTVAGFVEAFNGSDLNSDTHGLSLSIMGDPSAGNQIKLKLQSKTRSFMYLVVLDGEGNEVSDNWLL